MDTAPPIPVASVIALAGGPLALASVLGINRTTPYSWARVPARHVMRVSALTGLPPHRLRPDIFQRVPTNTMAKRRG